MTEQEPKIEPSPEELEFVKKKAKFYSKFALSHMEQMRILKEGGVLGDGKKIKEDGTREYGENKQGSWRNVSQHCLTEAVAADVLAELLGVENRENLVQGVLIHDWYKPQEKAAWREHGATEGHKISSAEDERLLRERGVPEEIIHLAHANIPETGNKEDWVKRSLEDKIMHFVDMITSGDKLTDPESRLRAVEARPADMAFLDSFRPKFDGKHLNEVQREVIAQEQDEFEKQLGLEKGTLIEFLKQKIKERIETEPA